MKTQNEKPEGFDSEQPIRISTDLVQLDVVITDKNGRVVKGLTKDDFELFEKGKRQPISFFEFVSANRENRAEDAAAAAAHRAATRGLAEREVSRVFAFVVDDLTVRFEDLSYVRELLVNFIDRQMQPSDMVAIIRTVGGKGLLQQFTTDKDLLRRAIATLLPAGHPLNIAEGPWGDRSLISERVGQDRQGSGLQPSSASARALAEGSSGEAGGSFDDSFGPSIEAMDVNSVADESDKSLRAFMTLSTASFVIDSMQELPGRKSLVLISGGLPLLGAQSGGTASRVSNLLNLLTDNATRASVAIHTMDVRGLQVLTDFKLFEESPLGTPAMPVQPEQTQTGPRRAGGGRVIDPRTKAASVMDLNTLGNRSAFNGLEAQEGLRALASATGGISVTNTNNFNKGMEKILAASEGYYLLAYTPSDSKFDGDFRKIEVKVKAEGLKVHSRRGYFAREDKTVAPVNKQEQLLAAIKSPLARRDVDLDAMLVYKAAPPNRGAIDIHLTIDPRKLQFEQAADRKQINLDVAGFVFDEFGKLRGGFSETIKPDLSADEYSKAEKGGLNYSANTELPSGVYQVRLVVRDNKTGALGTLSRYFEVPDLSKGRLAASSLVIGSVPANSSKAGSVNWITASRRVSRQNNLLYATSVYNAKLKDGKPHVTTQLTLTRNGKMVYQSPEEPVATSPSNPSQLMRVGQLKVSSLPAGKYVMTLKIIDTLAEKRMQTLSRKMDFTVVD
ncbi:MAG TPA: VWA domain-containing protein [Blastocatellia bacterium]|nr:VWA domain-containing protein [Blastocatellia bacterium]